MPSAADSRTSGTGKCSPTRNSTEALTVVGSVEKMNFGSFFQYEFTTPDRGHGESPVNKNPRGEEEKEIGIDELSSK